MSCSLPFDFTHYYAMTYLMAVWSVYTSVLGLSTVLFFVFGLCVHVAAQFDILSARLRTIIDRELDAASSSSDALMLKLNDEQNKIVHEKLMEIVKQHDSLLDISELMSQSFTWIVLCHFILAAIQICACSLMLFLTDGIEWLQFFLASVSFLFEGFVFAYAGQAIINSSTGLQDAAYGFQWYTCDTKNRRMILLIMTRAQKKISLQSPFFEVSMESYLKVSIKSLY